MRRALFIGGIAIVAAAAASPIAARAGSPNPIPVSTGGGPVTYTGTDTAGQPDVTGPPAPVCSGTGADGCDRETVNLSGSTSKLSFTVTYTPSDPQMANCLDIAIENSASTVAMAHSTCAPSGTTISDPIAATGAYTIEVDADNVNAVGDFPQPFMGSVSAVAATVGGGPTPTPIPANPFTFTHQISVDVQRGDGEPDVAIAPNNTDMFTGTPWGFSTTVSMLWKSQDGGVQWDNLHGSSVGDIPACPSPVADVLRPDCSRGGGDAEVQFSQPSASGGQPRVQFVDLNGLDSISCAYSDNGGDTFTDLTNNGVAGAACDENGTPNPNCTANPSSPTCASLGTDRQWMQVWPAAENGTSSDILYMTFDTGDQPPSGDSSIFSTNNGGTWSIGCTTTTGSSCIGGANGVGSRPGPLVINPTLLNHITAPPAGVTAGTYPTLYEFMGTNSSGTEVNISCDGGQTWSNIATSNGQAGSTTNDFVAGAMDANGELYTAYSVANDPNPWRVWFAHSTDSSGSTGVGDCTAHVQGKTWSTPVALTGPPSSADGVGATPIPSLPYAVMPWLTAGSGGRVDLVYYGTTAGVGLSPDSEIATWYMHMAQTLDGGASWTDEQATETPMHTKTICFSGIGCTAQMPPGGDRNLLDFFQVKPDKNGRAVIIYTDDNNTAACASTCTQGIGLISSVQQATGPSLYSTVGSVPALTSELSQSLDVRQAGVNADVTHAAGTAILPTAGHNISGAEDAAADITDLKVCLTNVTGCPVANTAANTLAFLFKVSDLSGGPGSAVVAPHTSANWLVTWRSNNDLWYAQATSDIAGTLTCTAGRPLSVYNDGEPKAAEYTGPPTNSEATGIPTAGCIATPANNTIEIDVPFSDVGVTTSSELYGLTGWTGNAAAALDATVCGGGMTSADNCSGAVGFFDNISETAPLDVLISQPNNGTPETPYAPMLIGLGLIVTLGGGYLRSRRRRPISI